MAKVITFSRQFPAYHPRKGEPTYFVEKLYNSIPWDTDAMDEELGEALNDYCMDNPSICKHHTIRSGNRWKAGDFFSPRVWSGKPYNSKMITIAPDIEIKKVWDVEMKTGIDSRHRMPYYEFIINGKPVDASKIATNDGLDLADLLSWFQKPFKGQIICWNENIEY